MAAFKSLVAVALLIVAISSIVSECRVARKDLGEVGVVQELELELDPALVPVDPAQVQVQLHLPPAQVQGLEMQGLKQVHMLDHRLGQDRGVTKNVEVVPDRVNEGAAAPVQVWLWWRIRKRSSVRAR
ncbi:hypothetical protein OIU76_026873 [Salix suchowensis]|nr:hypothetical protein OIU76_026873 [Salix suchowensis]